MLVGDEKCKLALEEMLRRRELLAIERLLSYKIRA